MKKVALALSLLAVCVINSCKKTEPIGTNTTFNTYSSMDAVYDLLRNQPKIVTLNAATGGSFYGNSGTRYVFPANAFMDATGATITGTVQIAATEYLKRGEMIFSKALPISNGEPLESGGEVNVVVTHNGQEVFLRPGFYMQANLPQGGTAVTGMSLFHGLNTSDTTSNKINWQPQADTFHGFAIVITPGDTIKLVSDSLKLCNADQFLNSPNYQKFNINASLNGINGTDITSIHGMTLYDNYNGVWPNNNFANGSFREEHVPNIPVHFVAIALVNNRFYGGIIGITPSTGSTYNITLNEVDPVEFRTQISNLPH